MPGGLYTFRLHLRPLAQGDERLYCSLYTGAEVMRHVSTPLTPEAAERAFRAVLRQLAAEPPQSRYWILAPREGGADLGLMAWVPDRDDTGSAEVGLLLVVPAQCRGYAAEAIAVLADEVFAVPPLQRLWTRHASDNAAATGLMRKLGFQRMEDTTGPAPVRWQLQRQVWATRRLPGFASLPASC